MKVCPQCQFSNEERFPACLWCNAPLMDVRSTPSADPHSPEHRQRARSIQQDRSARRQTAFALFCYTAVTVGLAVCPGMVGSLRTLSVYGAAGLAVGLSLAAGWLADLPAAFLQGTLSLVLLLNFGPVQPFAFFMLLGHVLLPMVFVHWLEMIHDAHR